MYSYSSVVERFSSFCKALGLARHTWGRASRGSGGEDGERGKEEGKERRKWCFSTNYYEIDLPRLQNVLKEENKQLKGKH